MLLARGYEFTYNPPTDFATSAAENVCTAGFVRLRSRFKAMSYASASASYFFDSLI